MDKTRIVVKVAPTLTQIVGTAALAFLGGYLGAIVYVAGHEEEKPKIVEFKKN